VKAKGQRGDRIAVAFGSLAYVGFFPMAPATLASAIATGVFAAVMPLSGPVSAALVGALFLAGVWSCERIERLYGHDPSAAVMDEVCGMAITLAWVPITAATLVLGFLLFRVFDVLKLWPGRAAERVHGGWGIMLDDVVAGIYAALVLQACCRLWPDMQIQAWHWGVLAIGTIVLFLFRKPLLRKYGKPPTLRGARR
jgi:phosphatidylglycerophosphatase A